MEKVKELIAKLTLEEKASLCSGADFWHMEGFERLNIPSIMLTDGPHGLRKQTGDSTEIALQESVPATCFPTASALAATWNRELIYQVGEALADTCKAENVGVILGPGANIKRSPLCGRNFEYFSEDPYLSGEMAKAHIQGVQSKGIGTSLKHFAVNNQEFRRLTIDAVVDERALHEIYLAGFEIAVKEAQPWTVMCAYNQVNGTMCSEHKYLLTDVLRQQWGFEGIVVTDWGAIGDRVTGLQAGVDLEMPGVNNGYDARIVAAVRQGQLDQAVLDATVERLLNLIMKAAEGVAEPYDYDRAAQHALARQVAGEGAVLLKNGANVLPLTRKTKVALLGEFAKKPRYQGAGSSLMNPTQIDTLYEEMVALAGEESIIYAPGYDQIPEAVALAEAADVVIVHAGLPDSFEIEGLDREHMRLPDSHNALIEAVADVNPNVVVVLSNGAPVEMPWIGKVKAVLEGYLGGQAGAGAIADILYGQVNPSGKLAETFPIRLEDNPSYASFPGGPATIEYRESIYVGYRYYDTAKRDVLFPFGHGLSYTTFEYSDLQVSSSTVNDSDTLTISATITNTGSVAGKEIVQLYVKDVVSTLFRPEKELKGFVKVTLEPGEKTTVSFTLSRRAFAYYDDDEWRVESGEFEILVGASSRDIRLSETVTVNAARPVPDVNRQALAAYYTFDAPISRKSFEALLGHAVPENVIKKPYTINTPIADMKGSLVAKFLRYMMRKQIMKMIGDEQENPSALLLMAVIDEAPLRTLMMAGGMTIDQLEALLMMVNGKLLRGAVAMFRARRNL